MNKKALVLVLDDDPDICTMITIMLQYNGYDAADANSEEEALKVLSSTHVDLVIMDMLLSGVNGTDVCRRLKQHKKTSSVPVLMFSAHPNAKIACLAAGADDFIAKPFDMNDMMVKIHFLVNEKKVKQR
jgi:DNA-binding response OmpR family regulator